MQETVEDNVLTEPGWWKRLTGGVEVSERVSGRRKRRLYRETEEELQASGCLNDFTITIKANAPPIGVCVWVIPGSCSTVLAACCTCSAPGWLAPRPAAAGPPSPRWAEPRRTSRPPRTSWWRRRAGRLRPPPWSPAGWTASAAGPRTFLLGQGHVAYVNFSTSWLVLQFSILAAPGGPSGSNVGIHRWLCSSGFQVNGQFLWREASQFTFKMQTKHFLRIQIKSKSNSPQPTFGKITNPWWVKLRIRVS